ncbi:MAG: ATP-binding cassette domain-containing protein [SAR324 cluster bacterium]|nr:ATP-binding cassette domain-containing protein [SAR324 cluster bacterium]MBL7034331.1 ATP-binding cassette domain-containing protein [SAR324 cluster bacterium]
MLIEFKNETIAYKNKVVFRDFSLEINEKERVALIGPSGAGKSTLLRAIYNKIAEQASYVPQDYGLVPQISVLHNVYMGRLDQHSSWQNLRTLIRPATEIKTDITDLLAELGISNMLKKRAGELSGGEQQRVAVGRAIYRNSPVMIADEPVSAVDPHQAHSLLETLSSHSPSLILSLHSVELALSHATRVIGLRDGNIYFDAVPDKISSRKINKLFSKNSQVNTSSKFNIK